MANQIQFSAISDTGRVRDNNEDNLYVSSQYMKQGEQGNFQLSKTTEANSFVCAVCDGMGGEKSGERASFEAVSKLHYAVSTNGFPDMTLMEKIQEINKYIGETNAAIYNMAAGSFDFKGMGTTFVCLVIAQNQAAAMNVGDSRVYLFRDGFLKQLTRDHSESERLIRLGIITREQARGHKSRFMLNRHLGMPPEEGILEADTSEIIQLQKGDRFLLCSDGLTDMVEDEIIKDILSASTDTKEAAQILVNEALKNGGKDNVTAIVLKLDNFNGIGSTSGSRIHSIKKVSRKERSLIVALIAAIVVIIILAVAFLGNSHRSNTNESKNGFVSKNTIGAAGGTITIEGSPGITFEVPSGSFENDVSFNIRLENTDALQLPVEMNPIIPLITVEGVTSYSNKPISITVPVTIDQGSTIMAGYYNKETNTVTPITVFESAENQIELLVSHFSSILVFEISDDYISSVNEADSGFRPGVDDWQFKNDGSFLAPGGACSAQSITAQTYFMEKKITSQQSLYGKYDNLSYSTPDFWEDDCNPYRFVSIVQSQINNMMPQFMDEIAKNNNIGYILRSDAKVFKSIKYYLDAYHQPLLLYMVSGKDTHLCIAYRYQGDTIYISDPNYPGEERSVEFNRKIGEFGSFEDYQSGTRTASQFLLVDAKYFISRSVENNYWDELDSGTVSPNGFPDVIVQYRMEDGTFRDLTENSSISIAQGTTLYVRGSTALPDGKALYFKLYNLKDGQTPILLQDLSDRVDYKISDAGIYGISIWVDMKGNGNKSDCEWLDFSWFSINTGSPQIPEFPEITEPSMTSLPPSEIHTLEGTFQGSEWGDFCHIYIKGNDGADYSFLCLNMESSVDWENLDIGHKVIVMWQNIDKELTIGNTTVMQNVDEILSLELNDNTQQTEQTESSDMIQVSLANTMCGYGRLLVQEGDWIYFALDGIYRMKTDGTEINKISDTYADFLCISDGWLFGSVSGYEFYDYAAIFKVKVDGTDESVILEYKSGSINSFQIEDDQLYFGSPCEFADEYDPEGSEAGGIYRMNLDGSELRRIAEGDFYDFIVQSSWVYYGNRYTPSTSDILYKIKNDGTSISEITPDEWLAIEQSVTSPTYIDDFIEGVDIILASQSTEKYIYYYSLNTADTIGATDNSAGCPKYTLYRIDTDGTGQVEIASAYMYPFGCN